MLQLAEALHARGGGLIVLYGKAQEVIDHIAKSLAVDAVLVNADYEPQARARDAACAQRLAALGIAFRSDKDQVILPATRG